MVAFQFFQRVLADMTNIFAGRLREPPDKVLDEQRNIFRPLAQRRNRDWKDVQPIEKILAEGSGGNSCPQVTICCRYHPHVYRDRMITPHPLEFPLLRVLQEREFERVGSNHPISVDVRVIAATNRDLRAAVAAGTFREDLFYRLNVFPIAVPPLRERAEDIALLVEYFVGRFAKAAGKDIRHVSKHTLEELKGYHWPGNIS